VVDRYSAAVMPPSDWDTCSTCSSSSSDSEFDYYLNPQFPPRVGGGVARVPGGSPKTVIGGEISPLTLRGEGATSKGDGRRARKEKRRKKRSDNQCSIS